MSYAPPSGEPPRPRPPPQERNNSLDPAIPDEAPPAYTAVSTDQVVQQGPSRMDFSGPPPMPERLMQTATGGQVLPGVGVGYGPTLGGGQQYTGGGAPPPPPRHPSVTGRPPPSPNRPQATGTSGASSGPPDLTPTEAPVPGRPLLHNGQLLVYPKGHFCSKCQNTGYKGGNVRSPCSSDWRKYGKSYNGALAASYATFTKPGANPTATAAQNFQRPLPQQHQPQMPQYGQPPPPPPPPGMFGGHPGQGYGPGGAYNQVGGYGGYGGGYGGYNQQAPMVRSGYRGPPPGALVLKPGDPRIGGQLCWHCNGSGQEVGLFFFDDGPCRYCRGIGRLF